MPTLNRLSRVKPEKQQKKKGEQPQPDPRVPCNRCPASRMPHDMPQMTVSRDSPGFCLTRGLHGLEPTVSWEEAIQCPGTKELEKKLEEENAPPKPTG